MFLVLKNLNNCMDNSEPRLHTIATSIRSKLARRNRDAIAIGLELIEAKEITGHGNWEAWLEQEFEWSDRTARRYMQVAREIGQDCTAVLSTSARVMYLLSAASTPEEAKAEIISKLENGEQVSDRDARAIADKHKPEIVTVIAEESPFYRQEFEVVKRSGGMIEAKTQAGETIGLLNHWVEEPRAQPQRQETAQVRNPLAELSDHNAFLAARVKLLEEFITDSVDKFQGINPQWCEEAREILGQFNSANAA